MMRDFGKWMMIIFGLASLLLSCINKNKNRGYFVIGEHRKEITAHNQSNNNPPPPPLSPMNYYPYVNILLTDSACFIHYDNSRVYPNCGTGVDYSYVRRLNLQEDQIIPIKNMASTLSTITSQSPDKMILDIASATDTIKNPLFYELVQVLGKLGYNSLRVRHFTEEEKCVLYKKLYQTPCNIDSLDWDKRPKIDALFDMDEDGKFELHERLK